MAWQGRATFQRQQQSQPDDNVTGGQLRETPSTGQRRQRDHRERAVRLRAVRPVTGQQFLPFPAVAGRRARQRRRRTARPDARSTSERRLHFFYLFIFLFVFNAYTTISPSAKSSGPRDALNFVYYMTYVLYDWTSCARVENLFLATVKVTTADSKFFHPMSDSCKYYRVLSLRVKTKKNVVSMKLQKKKTLLK